MALPPTKPTSLFPADGNPDACFDALVGAGCLNEAARRDRKGFLALVARADELVRPPKGEESAWTGPNLFDPLSGLLVAEGLLSPKGLKMAQEDA